MVAEGTKTVCSHEKILVYIRARRNNVYQYSDTDTEYRKKKMSQYSDTEKDYWDVKVCQYLD